MPGVILDWTGKPATYMGSGAGQLYARTAADDRLRGPVPNLYDDYVTLLSPWRWRLLLNESRAIASRGQVKAAIWQKADYVSGSHWRPFFTGEDAAWGEQAEQLLEDTNNNVCTRGERWPWRQLWRLSVPTRAADGGFFLLLTESADGWPLFQPIEAHRVGQRGASQIVPDGSAFSTMRDENGNPLMIATPYAGLRMINGIIYNKAGAEVAYRVLGPGPGDDEDISARDMIHVAAPTWYSEGRPIPEIAAGLMDIAGIDIARIAQLDQQILDSKLTFIEANDNGRQDPVRAAMNPPFTGPTPMGTQPEVVERGTWRYVKNGSWLKAHESARPSDQWMNYDERISQSGIAAIGWRLEMLDPSQLKGANTRAFQDQINTAILNSFEEARPFVVRATRYRISKLIKRGMLPDNPDFMKWDITPPPEFVVDRSAVKSDIEEIRAGGASMPQYHRRSGSRPRQVLTEQAKYLLLKGQIAKEWSRDGITIKPEELGTLSIPGDVLAKPGATDPENPNTNAAP